MKAGTSRILRNRNSFTRNDLVRIFSGRRHMSNWEHVWKKQANIKSICSSTEIKRVHSICMTCLTLISCDCDEEDLKRTVCRSVNKLLIKIIIYSAHVKQKKNERWYNWYWTCLSRKLPYNCLECLSPLLDPKRSDQRGKSRSIMRCFLPRTRLCKAPSKTILGSSTQYFGLLGGWQRSAFLRRAATVPTGAIRWLYRAHENRAQELKPWDCSRA